jgi:hypothetical protein
MRTIETDWGYKVHFDDSEETKKQVFEAVISWFQDHEVFIGEGIMQSDDCLIEAPELLAQLADNIIKFEYEDDSND